MRLAALLALGGLMSLASRAAASSCFGGSLSVCASGCDFTTISDAVAGIPKTPLTGDWCVDIQDPGPYAEQVTVSGFDTNGFQIVIGTTTGSVRPVVAPPTASAAAFRILNASVTLQRVDIVPATAVSYGVLASSDNVTLSSINVQAVGYVTTAGVSLASWSRLVNSTVAVAGADAVLLDNSQGTWVLDTWASNNSGSFYALHLQSASSNTMSRSSFANPEGVAARLEYASNFNTVLLSTVTSGASGAAFDVYLSSANMVRESLVRNTSTGSGYGVTLGGSTNNTILLSTVTSLGTGTSAGGVYLNNSSPLNSIDSSYIQGAHAVDITMTSNGTAVSSSTLAATDADGIGLAMQYGNSGLLMTGNRVLSGASGTGISIGNSNTGLLQLSSNVIQGARYGLDVAPSPDASLAIDSMTFASMASGATGILFSGTWSQAFAATFTAVNFDDSLQYNISASALSSGSTITVRGAAGAKAGPTYADDPSHYVKWASVPPVGCSEGFNVAKSGADFSTIQAALTALSKDLAGDACVVIRDTQTYQESVKVEGFQNNGFQVKIMADPSFVSSAPVVSPIAAAYAAFDIQNASVTLQHIDIRTPDPVSYGVKASSAHVTLMNVNVDGGAGILAAGIALSSFSSLSTSSVTVQDAAGIVLTGRGSLVSFSSAAAQTSSHYALLLDGASQNSITGFYAQNLGPVAAMLRYGADNNSITTSTFSGSTRGLAVYQSSSNTVASSFLYGGLVLSEAADNEVRQSFLQSSSGDGAVDVFNAAASRIFQSTVTGVGSGFILSESSATVIGGCLVTASTAVYISGSTNTVIDASSLAASDTMGYGLWLANGSAGLSLSSTTISGGAYGAGVRLGEGNSGTLSLTSNTVHSTLFGLSVGPQAGASLEIKGMTFRDLISGATAIHFLGGAFVSTFSQVDFADDTIATNVNASSLASSTITMTEAFGPRFGPAYANDPYGYVHWGGGALVGGTTPNFSTGSVRANQYYENGKTNALAVDRLGDLHVAYINKYNGSSSREVYYVKRTAGAWGSPQWVAAMGGADGQVCLALDADNRPHIAYWNGALKYARYNGSSWVVSTADASTGAGQTCSLALDAAGNPHIAYQDLAASPHDIRYKKFDGAAWSAPVIVDYALYTTGVSMALDASGKPVIAYYGDEDVARAKIAAFDGVQWATAAIETSESGGMNLSLAIDGSGISHVSYAHPYGTLKYGMFMGTTTLSLSIVDTAGAVGNPSAIGLDGAGHPQISYFDGTNNNLKYALHDGVDWSTSTLDAAGNIGAASSLSLDGAGDVHVIYTAAVPFYDEIDLKAAHWTGAGLAPAMGGGNGRGGTQRPTGLGVQAIGSSSITWAWRDNAVNESGFALYGGATSTGPFTLIASTAAIAAAAGTGGLKTFVETGLAPGAVYFRYVAAVNAGGAACSSGTVVATLPPAPPVLTAPVGGLAVGAAHPLLAWTSDYGPGSRVQLALDSGLTSVIADSVTANSFYLSTNTLSDATTYWWRAKADAPAGAWSGIANFSTDLSQPLFSGPLVSTSPSGSFKSLSSYIATTTATVRVTVMDSVSGLLVSTGLPSGLVGQWHFDESSGPVALDATPYANDGTLVGGSTWTAGIKGGGISFNSPGNYMSIPPVAMSGPDWTVEAWSRFPLTLNAAYNSLVGSGQNDIAHVLVDADGNLGTFSSGMYSSGYNIGSLAGWHHIAAVAGGSPRGTSFYIDGIFVGLVPVAVDGASSPINTVGNDGSMYTTTQYWGGTIDEVRIFNVARSSAQVLADYQSDTLSAHNRGRAYSVFFSSDAGANWSFVSTGSVHLSGAQGVRTAQTLQADDIPLAATAEPGAPTNQVAFVVSDMAGNVSTAAYVVLVGSGVPKVWSGAGTDQLASNPANWVGGVAPESGDSVEFSTGLVKGVTFDLAVSLATTRVRAPFASTITVQADFTNAGDFTSDASSAAVVDFGSRHVAFGGDILVSSITFLVGQSTMTFNGGADQTVRRLGAPMLLGHCVVDKPAGARLRMASDSQVFGDFTIISGTYAAGPYRHEMYGDIKEDGGHLDVAQSTVEFRAASRSQTVRWTGGTGTAFSKFSVLNPMLVVFDSPFSATTFEAQTPGSLIRFHDGGGLYTFTFGAFLVAGSTANPVTLRSMTPGTPWYLKVTGTSGVSYADVRDSNASLGRSLGASNAVDSGGNVNWVFVGGPPQGCATALNVRKAGGDYDTIQAAVEALPASLGANACVVVRDTETYAEQVTVEGIDANGFQVKIMADPSFVSSAPVVSPPASSQAAFLIRSASVTVQGLNILAAESMPYGVFAASGSVTLSSVNVDGGWNLNTAGIALTGWDTVTGSSVTTFATHAFSLSGEGNSVRSSTGLAEGTSAYGLYLEGASSSTVIASVFRSATSHGAVLANSAYNSISLSTMTGGDKGLYLDGAAFNTISRSSMTGVSYGAYLGAGSDSNAILRSSLQGEQGLFLTQASSNSVVHSTMTGAVSGLEIDGGASNAADGCRIQGGSGAVVRLATGTTIDSSVLVATGTGGAGVLLGGQSAGFTLSSSTVYGAPDGTGISLEDGNSGRLRLSSDLIQVSPVGLSVAPQPGAVLSVSSLTFQSLLPGATAISFAGGTVVSTFTGIKFADSTIGTNVDASTLLGGSRVTLWNAWGSRAGAAYANDPNRALLWRPQAHPSGVAETSIAATDDNELAAGAAFGAGKFFVPWQVDDGSGPVGLAGRFVYPGGSLSAPVFYPAVGSWCGVERPRAAFDGVNFLMVSACSDSRLQALLVDTAGVPVGSPLDLGVTSNSRFFQLAFDGSSYFVVWAATAPPSSHLVLGRFVTPAGTMPAAAIEISVGDPMRNDPSVAFGSGTYLVVWHDDQRLGNGRDYDLKGRLVRTDGSMPDAEFSINEGTTPGGFPPAAASSGENFFVAWQNQVDAGTSGNWNLTGAIVSSTGAVSSRFPITSNPAASQNFPTPVWDGNNYQVFYDDAVLASTATLHRRVYSVNGVLVGADTALANPVSGKIPKLGGLASGGGKVLALVDRFDFGGGLENKDNDDVYGLLLSPSSATAGSLAGAAAYSGTQGGRVLAGAFSTSTFKGSIPVSTAVVSNTGTYYLGGLPGNSTYYLAAFVDVNANGRLDSGEDWGAYASTAPPTALSLLSGADLGGLDFPINAASTSSLAQVSGTVSYATATAAELHVEFWSSSSFLGQPVAARIRASTGPYTVPVPGGQPYYIRAWLDFKGTGAFDSTDPSGIYAPNNQGAEAVYVPSAGSLGGIDLTVRDAGSQGGGVAGEGTASILPSTAAAGAQVFSATITYTAGANGVGLGGGVGFSLPSGFPPPLPRFITATSTSAATLSAISTGPVSAFVTVESGQVKPGQQVVFVYTQGPVPCMVSTRTFTVAQASNGSVTRQALLAGSPMLRILPGGPAFLQPANPSLALTAQVLSDAQSLLSKDACGNVAAIPESLGGASAALRATRYDMGAGGYVADPSVGLSTAVSASTAGVVSLAFAVGRSSADFYVLSTSTGYKNIEIVYDLSGPATFYYSLNALPNNALTGVSVSELSYGVGQSSASITPVGGGASAAYVFFNLGDPAQSWHVLVSSTPLAAGVAAAGVWESWGQGQPRLGQIAWDGRYSPWINNGSRVPSGTYYVRIEVAGGGVRSDSLLVGVSAPQLAGKVYDSGVSPNPPLDAASLQIYGANGSMYTQSDSGGAYALPGLAAGAYKLSVNRADFLDGSFSVALNAAGGVSTFTALCPSSVAGSSNATGGLDVLMNRAAALFVVPTVSVSASTQAVDRWGSLQVNASTSIAGACQKTYYAPLRLAASTTTVDDGGQWDAASQQFLTRTRLRFAVAPGTYTVSATLPGFSPSSATVYVPAAGATLELPSSSPKSAVSGLVSVPAGANPGGRFVSVNAVNLSSSSAGGAGGVYLPSGVLSGTYTVANLDPGNYMLRANTKDFISVSTGPIAVPVSSEVSGVDFTPFSSGAGISGRLTFSASTAGDSLQVSVNAWSPGALNFGATSFALTGGASGLGADYAIRGLTAGATYQVYVNVGGHNGPRLELLGAQPRLVLAPATADFEFITSSGAILGAIKLPSGSTDFVNVSLLRETVASALHPEDVGLRFQVQNVTDLPGFLCQPSGLPPTAGYCGAGNSSSSFTVTGLGTETDDVTLSYATTGQSKKTRVSVVNGSTTSLSVDLSPQTFSISGSVNNQVTSSLFNTNQGIFDNAPFFAQPGYPADISSTTARVEAIRQDLGQFNVAISTVFNPASTRVGFLTAAGTFTIANVPSGVYFVRSQDLRSCATCSVLVPSVGQVINVAGAGVTGLSLTLRDGYTASGSLALEGGLQDARVFTVAVRNQRQEVVRSTTVYLGDTDLGVTANSVAYSFTNLPAGNFYTLTAADAGSPQRYVGPPLKFPNPGLSPNGLQADLSLQDLVLQRAAYITGRMQDANTGELIGPDNATLLAPNFQITAAANPWVEGGFAQAVSSISARPVQDDGSGGGAFLVGPLLPSITYDLKLAQQSWDPSFLASGSQNYAPVVLGGLTPEPGQTLDAGVVSLHQGQALTGTVRQSTTTGALLGNIQVTAQPSYGGNSGMLVQTFTGQDGRYTLWVSTYVSNQFDVSAAPSGGNTASNGTIYGQVTRRNVNLLATTTADFLLEPLLATVTGQVVVADAASGGVLSYPFGTQKGYPAAAVFLQPQGVVPKVNPLGDTLANTDSSGFFSAAGLSTGTYSLRAVSLGYSVFNATVAVAPSTFEIFTGSRTPSHVLAGNVITLSQGASITGRILKSDGSAPSDSEVGGIAAANFPLNKYVVGSIEVDQTAKTVDSYSISGFEPGVSYDLMILPVDKSEAAIFPAEGDDVTFAAQESSTTKNINLTYAPGNFECTAIAKTLGNRQFQIKISCSKGLRNKTDEDNDLGRLLTVSTATSAGAAMVPPNGTGALNGGDKKISSNRREITAVYRAAAGETSFSLRLRATAADVNPKTGSEFSLDGAFDFYTGLDSNVTQRITNISGGAISLEPSVQDELSGVDERSRLDFLPGSFALEPLSGSDPVASATTTVTVGIAKAFDRGSASVLAMRALGYVPDSVRGLGDPAALPPEIAAAMSKLGVLGISTATIGGVNPLSSFYSIFLPAGIRHQLKQRADLTLSYSAFLSSNTSTDKINVYFYNATLGQYVLENTDRRLDPVNQTVTVSVDHFSVFVVLDGTPVTQAQNAFNPGEILAANFPNPSDCIVHSGFAKNSTLFGGGTHADFTGTMIRYSLPSEGTHDATIRIYDVAGELVRSMPQGSLAGGFTYYTPWACLNQGGRTVASGVYIGEVEWNGRRRFFKIAIIKGSGL